MCKITLYIAGKTNVLYEVAYIRSLLHDYNCIIDFASIQYFSFWRKKKHCIGYNYGFDVIVGKVQTLRESF